QRFPGTRPPLILGVLSDKDWAGLAAALAPVAGRVLLVPVRSARSLAPASLAPICRETNPSAPVQVCASLAEALSHVERERDPIALLAGSLYLVGEALELLGLSTAPGVDESILNEWGGCQSPSRHAPH